MNPISLLTRTLTLPARTAGAVVSGSLHRTARVVGWAVERASGASPERAGQPWTTAPRVEPEPESGPVVVPEPVMSPPAEETVDEAPAPTVAEAVAKKAPAKKAPAKKAPTTKAAAKKAPAKKAPAKKTARKAPSKKAAVVAPALGLSEAEAEDVLRTPSGIPAAGDGTNPDTTVTDLHQPDTEPLMDPSLTKAVAKESQTLRKAADTDKD